MNSNEEHNATDTNTSNNTTINDNTNNNNNNNTNNDTNNNNYGNKYTPREKLMHLMSLLPNTLKDKENLVTTINQLGDRFSNFLGIQDHSKEREKENEKGKEKEKENNQEKDHEEEDIDEDEFVLVRSNEDITKEIKDEEFAKALQKEEIEGLKRRQAAQQQAAKQREREERQREREAKQRERERHREIQQREIERRQREEEAQLRQFLGPHESPDLFTLLLFGLDPPQQRRIIQAIGEPSSAPMYMYGAANPAQQFPIHIPQDEPSAPLPVVDSIPSHVYSGRPLPVEKNSCTICLNEFQQGETLKTLPCLHIYHGACIDEWMHVSRTCPVCKTSIV